MKIIGNAVNQAEKGTVIYSANEQIDSIFIIVKGRVLALNEGNKILLGSGSFVGISDLFAGRFLNTYIAYDDLTFYCFQLGQKENLINIFSANKDYRGVMTASLVRYLNEAEKIYSSLQRNTNQMYEFMVANYKNYTEIGKRSGYPVNTIDIIENIQPYECKYEVDDKKLSYYKECSKVSLEVWKNFCAAGDILTMYMVEDLSEIIMQLTKECITMSAYLVENFEGLMNSSESCLFKSLAVLAISIKQADGFNDEVMQIIDNTVDQINNIENLFQEKIGRSLTVDRKRMEEIYYALLSGGGNSKEQVDDQFRYTQNEIQQVEKDLYNSLKQILSYINMENEEAAAFEQLVVDYLNINDKYSTDDHVRILRKKITEKFYPIYEQAFFLAFGQEKIPKAVDLFLKYGYMDERLLTKEQLKELYFLDKEAKEKTGPCCIYNIKEWLCEILKGNKEPSKNEFDLDFKDMLRERRKRAEITEVQEKEYQLDLQYKVKYEISNVFRYNHRLVNGQITTFIPILCSGALIQSIEKMYVSAERLNNAVKEIMEIDYSIFHRESLYVNDEKGITKEYIMKQIYPDIILLPTAGVNGIMWQEITGKRKSSEGRFFLPIFTEQSIKDILIKVFGRFRWELCRSIQGSAWNNIKYKSLTSEYSDYLQFYRKNHDLSEEGKEKLKSQILRGKNNYREVFVIDYEAWLKSEVNGALRLNKVAREMLATYCPFSKPIRNKLMGQPIFADAMARFIRNSLKKARELDIRYRSLQKEEIEITEEMVETLVFYRDL